LERYGRLRARDCFNIGGFPIIVFKVTKAWNFDQRLWLFRLKFGNDTNGNLCGTQNAGGNDLTSTPFQYIFAPWEGTESYRKCVDQCPDEGLKYICKYNVSVPTSESAFAQKFKEKQCTFTYKTKPGKMIEDTWCF
jgi:hypothetical protein